MACCLIKHEYHVGLLGALSKLRKATVSFVMSVRLCAWNNSVPTGRVFMKSDIWVFLENVSRKFKFHKNMTGIMGTLHENLCAFLIMSRSVRLRMRNVSDKSCRESRNTHFFVQYIFFSKIVLFMR